VRYRLVASVHGYGNLIQLQWREGLAVKQIPSAELFVVRVTGDDKNAASDRLASIGKMKELSGTDSILLSAKKSTDSKAAWRHIRHALGSSAMIQPVLLDEQGNPHYPNGEISVRFNEVLSDKVLRQFAAKHKLRLRARNEFIPQQAMFELSDPARTYLPEVLHELTQTKETKEVWANTLSHYKRV